MDLQWIQLVSSFFSLWELSSRDNSVEVGLIIISRHAICWQIIGCTICIQYTCNVRHIVLYFNNDIFIAVAGNRPWTSYTSYLLLACHWNNNGSMSMIIFMLYWSGITGIYLCIIFGVVASAQIPLLLHYVFSFFGFRWSCSSIDSVAQMERACVCGLCIAPSLISFKR